MRTRALMRLRSCQAAKSHHSVQRRLAASRVWVIAKESTPLWSHRARHPPANAHRKVGCVRCALSSTRHLVAGCCCRGVPCAQMDGGFQRFRNVLGLDLCPHTWSQIDPSGVLCARRRADLSRTFLRLGNIPVPAHHRRMIWSNNSLILLRQAAKTRSNIWV